MFFCEDEFNIYSHIFSDILDKHENNYFYFINTPTYNGVFVERQ